MPLFANACIPVEIAPHAGDEPRVFRLTSELSVESLALAEGLPDQLGWLHDPLLVRFHLPGDPVAIECRARAREVVLHRDTERERAVLGVLQLIDLSPDGATRIEKYIEERVVGV